MLLSAVNFSPLHQYSFTFLLHFSFSSSKFKLYFMSSDCKTLKITDTKKLPAIHCNSSIYINYFFDQFCDDDRIYYHNNFKLLFFILLLQLLNFFFTKNIKFSGIPTCLRHLISTNHCLFSYILDCMLCTYSEKLWRVFCGK